MADSSRPDLLPPLSTLRQQRSLPHSSPGQYDIFYSRLLNNNNSAPITNAKVYFQWVWIRRVLFIAFVMGMLCHGFKSMRQVQVYKSLLNEQFLAEVSNHTAKDSQLIGDENHTLASSQAGQLLAQKQNNSFSDSMQQNSFATELQNSMKQKSHPSTDLRKESPGWDLFLHDNFLNTTLRDPELPECTSGNEFLSADGGDWVEIPTMEKNKSLDTDDRFIAAPCKREFYEDRYVWKANCSIPSIPSTLKHANKTVKLLLVGDSLHRQVMDAVKMQMGLDPMKGGKSVSMYGVEFHLQNVWNPMLISVPFKSVLCPSCNKLFDGDDFGKQIKLLSEDQFSDRMSGYDYIFYNEYAHFVKSFFQPLYVEYLKSKNSTDVTNKHEDEIFLGDVYDYFERQIRKKAELIAKTGAKAYFRTAWPHAYQSKTLYGNITQRDTPLESPVSLPISKCEVHKDDKYGATCYSIVNDIASRAFWSHGLGVLDTGKILSQRIDAHPASVKDPDPSPDFLHFCQPGPISVLVAGILTEIYSRERNN